MFEFAHSQMEASRECPAIDIPKAFTNNLFLKTTMAKSATRCQCGSTGDRICCSMAAFPQGVPALGEILAAEAALGAAEEPGARHRLSPAPLNSAQPRSALLSPERLQQVEYTRKVRERLRPSGWSPCAPRGTWSTGRCCDTRTPLELSPWFVSEQPRRTWRLQQQGQGAEQWETNAQQEVSERGLFYKIHPFSHLFILPSPAVQAVAALPPAAQDLSWPGPRRCCQVFLSGQQPWESHSGLSLEFQVGTFLTQAKNKCEWGSILWICWAANYILKLKSETRFASG